MTPQIHNISVYQGSTDGLSITWKRDGVAVNLTGYSAKMQVRYSAQHAESIAEYSTANGKIAALGSDGVVSVSFDSASLAALPAGSFVYDLDVTSGTDTRTILAGAFSVSAQVTR